MDDDEASDLRPDGIAQEKKRLRPLLERCRALLDSMRSTGVDEIGRLREDLRHELEKP